MASKAISAERRRAACWLALALVASSPALAEDYPARPVRIISQAGIGSAPDVMARIVADQLGKTWGQQAIIITSSGSQRSPDGGRGAGRLTFHSWPSRPPSCRNADRFDVLWDFVPVGFVAEQ